jgi:sorbitol/mannitol transport system substrate-binding protein
VRESLRNLDSVPPGSRTSTYAIPEYQKATADFSALTLASINGANPLQPTVDPVPYTGAQYVDIPEFEEIGDFTSQQIAGAISGQLSVADAIKKSEAKAKAVLNDAGYK